MAKQKTREELLREIDSLMGEKTESDSRLRENINNDISRRNEILSMLGKSVQGGGVIGNVRFQATPTWTHVFFELGKLVEKAENNNYTSVLLEERDKLHSKLHEVLGEEADCGI
mgnify:FL=1